MKRKRGPATRWIPRAQWLAAHKPGGRAPRAPAARRAPVPSPELKFHDLDIDDVVVSATGTIQAGLNLIAQGVTESERIGRKCIITSIGWRYSVALVEQDAVPTPAPPETFRIMLVLDKQANGAFPAVLDILETADFQSFNNLANKSRFRTLMDNTFNLNHVDLASDGAGVVSSSEVRQDFTFFKKVKIPLEFSAGTGAIAEIRSNNLFVLLISRAGLGSFESKMRLRFTG